MQRRIIISGDIIVHLGKPDTYQQQDPKTLEECLDLMKDKCIKCRYHQYGQDPLMCYRYQDERNKHEV